MKQIKLTRNKIAIVDEEDFEKLNKHRWYCTSHNYAARRDMSDGGKLHYLHRDIMNPPPGMVVDHINGDKLDNRKSNLRICTQTQNSWNAHRKIGKVPYVGVYISDTGAKMGWHLKKKYAAKIKAGDKFVWLGRYETPEEASIAYEIKRRELHGEFVPKR